jgi:probable HAF family extracellular repeat protein
LPQNHDAVLWRHGTMIDLGTLPGDSCSNAYYVNSRGQVVGTSESRKLCLIPTGERAFLWEDGGPMIDLNTLIPAGSSLELTFAVAINDRGEIAGFGVPAGCSPKDVDLCGHAYVLIPCNGQDGQGESCQEKAESAAPISDSVSTQVSSTPTLSHRPPSARSLLDVFRANEFSGERPAPHYPDAKLGQELLHEPPSFAPTPSFACLPYGAQCRPGYKCCPGLVCVPTSTRAFCE